jgi:Flp pilus assembly pilin Flp
MKTKILQFLTDESGQDMVEYSLMIVLIGTVLMIYLTGMGMNLTSIVQKVGAQLELLSSKMP